MLARLWRRPLKLHGIATFWADFPSTSIFDLLEFELAFLIGDVRFSPYFPGFLAILGLFWARPRPRHFWRPLFRVFSVFCMVFKSAFDRPLKPRAPADAVFRILTEHSNLIFGVHVKLNGPETA